MYIHPSAKTVPYNNYALNNQKCTSYTSSSYYVMCERDRRYKSTPEIWEWRTSCPISHPFVFENGKSCCPVSMEDTKTGQGEQCDGSVLNRESTCCKGEPIKCPTTFSQQQCSNSPSGIKIDCKKFNEVIKICRMLSLTTLKSFAMLPELRLLFQKTSLATIT